VTEEPARALALELLVGSVGARAVAAAVSLAVPVGCMSAAVPPARPATSVIVASVGVPVRVRAAPRSPPLTTVVEHTCGVPVPDAGRTVPDQGAVAVDPRPAGAIAEWLPSLDQRPCRAQLTRLGQAVARRLAAAVDTGEPIQVGAAYACPFESGARVELFFQFAHRVVETVSVDLSGCRWIDAPARVSRFTPPDMQLELDTLAPPGWRLTR